MAEFGEKATALTAPQGAGATPIAPVKQQFVDTSIMPLVSDIGNIFLKGLGANQKAEAEQQKLNVVGKYTEEQQRINNAVSSGQMKPDVAATRSRALFGQYAAGNAQYIEDLSKARIALSGGSELGAIEKAETQAADLQKSRITNAMARGVTVYSWMDPETLEKTLRTSEMGKQSEMEMDRAFKVAAEKRSVSAEERTIYDREMKNRATGMITEMAGANIDKMSSFIRNLSDKVGTGMDPVEAQLVLTTEFAQIDGAIQAIAAQNPELAAPYRSIFNDMRELGKKALDPKTRAETSKSQYDEIINRAKLIGITTDPKMKAVVVVNEMLGGNAVTALNSTVPITDFIARMSKSEVGDGQFVPQVVGNPEVEKDVLGFLNNSIGKINAKGYKDNAKAEVEAINSVNHVLSQVADAQKVGKLDPSKMVNLANFFASPEYGKFAASGKLNSEAAQAAKQSWQTSYVPAVQKSVASRLETIQQSFSGGAGVSPKSVSSLIDVQFSGSGISFTAKNVTGMEGYEQKWQQKGVDDLNAVKKGINQMVHIGAHMEGHTNYAKYWEENRHLYLPQMFVRAGVVHNGYKSKGGPLDDPTTWIKVGE